MVPRAMVPYAGLSEVLVQLPHRQCKLECGDGTWGRWAWHGLVRAQRGNYAVQSPDQNLPAKDEGYGGKRRRRGVGGESQSYLPWGLQGSCCSSLHPVPMVGDVGCSSQLAYTPLPPPQLVLLGD